MKKININFEQKNWTKEPVQEPRTINVYYLAIKN